MYRCTASTQPQGGPRCILVRHYRKLLLFCLFCLSWERARHSPELARLSRMILLFLLPKCGHYGRMPAFPIYAMKQIRPGLCDATQALHQPRSISSLCCFKHTCSMVYVLPRACTWRSEDDTGYLPYVYKLAGGCVHGHKRALDPLEEGVLIHHVDAGWDYKDHFFSLFSLV